MVYLTPLVYLKTFYGPFWLKPILPDSARTRSALSPPELLSQALRCLSIVCQAVDLAVSIPYND